MQEYLTLWFLLVCAHFVCDYPLQGDFVAKFKFLHIDGKYNPIWYHCLTAHCFIHALGVYLITWSVKLAVFMLITHFVIDLLKCLNKINFNQDQALHLSVIAIIACSGVL